MTNPIPQTLTSLCAAVAITLSGQIAQAEVDPAASGVIVGFMRSYGCSLTAEQVDLFLPEMGGDAAVYDAVMADLVDRGYATGDTTVKGGVTLTPAFCGPSHAAPRDVMVEVIRFNGCTLSQEEAGPLLMPMGFMPDTIRPVVGEMIAAGDVIADGPILTLRDDLCQPG